MRQFCTSNLILKDPLAVLIISSHTSNIITNWGKLDILFSNPLFEDPLNLILIKSKQFIYRMKIKKSLPIFETFKMQLHHIFKTEEYIAKKKLDLETYRVKWEHYRALFELALRQLEIVMNCKLLQFRLLIPPSRQYGPLSGSGEI